MNLRFRYLIVFFLLAINITHAQNVGIGETSPANKLSVKGSFSVGSSYSATSAPSNGAIIQGNVGIGTASPAYTLDVTGSARVSSLSGTGVRVTYSNAAGALLTLSGSSSNRAVFTYSAGGNQTWTVPSGVTTVLVKLWGAGGGTNNGGFGGAGGFITGILSIPSGTTSMTIIVGQGGLASSGTGGTYAATYGGGGKGASGGSGGGRSAIQIGGVDYVTAGGGGGGCSGNYAYSGGGGGGYIGLTGGAQNSGASATGGSQTASGGASGTCTTGTTAGSGNTGGNACTSSYAGGGGGGWYGGGGGGYNSNNGGGGGGSSGGNSTYFSYIRSDCGQMCFSNTQVFVSLMPGGCGDIDYVAGVGTAGPTAGDAASAAGGNGLVVIEW